MRLQGVLNSFWSFVWSFYSIWFRTNTDRICFKASFSRSFLIKPVNPTSHMTHLLSPQIRIHTHPAEPLLILLLHHAVFVLTPDHLSKSFIWSLSSSCTPWANITRLLLQRRIHQHIVQVIWH